MSLAAGRVHAQTIAPGITIDPVRPPWALPEEALPTPITTEGTELLTRESEWHLEGASASQLVRRGYVMHTAASVAERSQLEISLPAGDTLTLVGVTRLRDGVAASMLRPEVVRVIQPEARFGEGVLDGSRRLLVLLEDVRVGDTIDYAYVRTQSLARFDGRFAIRETLEGDPSRRMRFVARWPSDRHIAVRAHALDRTPLRMTTESGMVRIEGDDLPLSHLVMDAPGWVDPTAWVELTEFPTWADVAAWAEPHFRTTGARSIEGVPLDAFRALPTDAARAQAALRFVQDDVRYLGIEIEERALVPSAPEVVAQRRYGDCKDKALLLVAILRALDIDATAALVDSERGHGLDDDLPSPLAFDHAVARATIDGHEVWMDATRSYEREPITALTPLPFERALLIAPGTSALAPIPMTTPTEPDAEIDEHYQLDARETLTVEAVFRGRSAAHWRETLASAGADSIAEALRGSYASAGLAPEILEAMRTEDDADGAVRTHVRFTIHGFWNAIERDVSAWSSLDVLPEPIRERPSVPLAIPYPRLVEHRVRVDAERWAIDPAMDHVTNAAFDVTRTIAVDGRTLRIATRVRTLADHVDAADIAAYDRDRQRAEEALGFAVFIDTHPDAPTSPFLWLWMLVALGVFALALWGVGATRRWRSARRQRQWQRRARPADGESPEGAIDVADLDEAQRIATSMTCCDAKLESTWSRAQLGTASAFVQRATCPSCERTHRRYFRGRNAPPRAVAES